jgi:hypothetical protein
MNRPATESTNMNATTSQTTTLNIAAHECEWCGAAGAKPRGDAVLVIICDGCARCDSPDDEIEGEVMDLSTGLDCAGNNEALN